MIRYEEGNVYPKFRIELPFEDVKFEDAWIYKRIGANKLWARVSKCGDFVEFYFEPPASARGFQRGGLAATIAGEKKTGLWSSRCSVVNTMIGGFPQSVEARFVAEGTNMPIRTCYLTIKGAQERHPHHRFVEYDSRGERAWYPIEVRRRPVDGLTPLRLAALRMTACVFGCGGRVKFDDLDSAIEYGISGMCQKCQNKTYGE